MKRIYIGIVSLALASLSLNAKGISEPAKIFTKKCAMCHIATTTKVKKKSDRQVMVAPSIVLTMKSITYGIDALEDPKDNKKLKKMSIEFMKDYLYAPVRDKSYCEDIIFKKFNLMPSMKGFITPKEMDLLLPWVYDKFVPKRYRVKEEKTKTKAKSKSVK